MNHRERYYYVYIMASLSGALYAGVANSIGHRVQQHKRGEGSAFTSRYRVNRLVYYESFRYILNATSREKEIKGWKRSKKVEEGRAD
jgi:putative endonuclease